MLHAGALTLELIGEGPRVIEARLEPALAPVAERFTWDAKAREVVGIYREILAR